MLQSHLCCLCNARRPSAARPANAFCIHTLVGSADGRHRTSRYMPSAGEAFVVTGGALAADGSNVQLLLHMLADIMCYCSGGFQCFLYHALVGVCRRSVSQALVRRLSLLTNSHTFWFRHCPMPHSLHANAPVPRLFSIRVCAVTERGVWSAGRVAALRAVDGVSSGRPSPCNAGRNLCDSSCVSRRVNLRLVLGRACLARGARPITSMPAVGGRGANAGSGRGASLGVTAAAPRGTLARVVGTPSRMTRR